MVERNREKWLIVVLSGGALFFVLFVYQGFQIEVGESLSGHSLWQRALLFGLATSTLFYVFEFHLRSLVTLSNTFGLVIFRTMELICGATATFFLFNYFWDGTEWNISAYLLLLFEYAAVMLIPFTIVWLIGRKNSSGVTTSFLEFISENNKQQVKVKPQELIYLKSADNYVEIHFISGKKYCKELIRNTLQNLVDQQSPGSELVRCHRSYVVNKANVDHVLRKNREVSLEIAGQRIPVSNKYQHHFVAI